MDSTEARKILADKLRHYGLDLMAADATAGQNTPIIMAALSAMQVAHGDGWTKGVNRPRAVGGITRF